MEILKKRISTQSAFDALVDEAVALYREAAQPPRFADSRNDKLTKQAYLAEALRNGKTTVAKLHKLEAQLAAEPDAARPQINAFMGAVYSGVAATRVDKGADLRPIVAGLHHRMLIPPEQFTNVLVEIMLHGTTPLELVALAVLQATEREPEAFGVIDDWDAHHAAIESRNRRLEQLYGEIGKAHTAADVEFVLTDARSGTGRLTWKRAPTVSVHPLPEGARQLVLALVG